jgi:hypothetical protein
LTYLEVAALAPGLAFEAAGSCRLWSCSIAFTRLEHWPEKRLADRMLQMKLLLASVLLGFTMPAVLGAQERQSPEETLKLCQAEVAAHPNSAEAYYALGKAYLRFLSRKETNTEAISAFNSAIKLRPDYAEAHCGIGDEYLHSTRP